MSDLPRYSPYDVALAGPSKDTDAPPPPFLAKRNLAGPIQTCSFSDMQYDYFKITRTSPITLSISLTTDPTPLYHVQLSPNSDPAVQVFDASSPISIPVAAARLQPSGKPPAKICTANPTSPSATWRVFGSYSPSRDYSCTAPLESVPGLPAVDRKFVWKPAWKPHHPVLECWLTQPLFYYSNSVNPRAMFPEDESLVASYGFQGPGLVAEGVLQLRRGGGLEFELAVVVQAFTVMELERKRNPKK